MSQFTTALGLTGQQGRCQRSDTHFPLIFGQTFPDGSLQFVVGDKELNFSAVREHCPSNYLPFAIRHSLFAIRRRFGSAVTSPSHEFAV
jgi:hypothetical protein